MTWVSKCSYISHVLQKSVNTCVNNNEFWIRCSCANSNSQWFQTENFETCWLSRHSGKSPQSRCSNLKQFQDQRYEYRCIVKYKFGKLFVKNENPQDSVNPFLSSSQLFFYAMLQRNLPDGCTAGISLRRPAIGSCRQHPLRHTHAPVGIGCTTQLFASRATPKAMQVA